jgi:hypothetical protein
MGGKSISLKTYTLGGVGENEKSVCPYEPAGY